MNGWKRFVAPFLALVASILLVAVGMAPASAASVVATHSSSPPPEAVPGDQTCIDTTGDEVCVEYIPAFSADMPVSAVTYSNADAQVTSEEATLMSFINCTIWADNPVKHGSWIDGDGDQLCTQATDQTLKVTLQRHSWGSVWNNLDSTPKSGYTDYLHAFAAFDCTGQGTRTYRVITDGSFRDIGGTWYSASVQSGQYLRVSC